MFVVPMICPRCGAPGRHVADSLLAVCAYCGAVIARHRDAIEGATAMVRRSYLALVNRDEQAARVVALQTAQEDARSAGDRLRFEALVLELLLLELAEDPSRVPPHTTLAMWARTQASLRTLTSFEPELVASFRQLSVAAVEADPRAAGAEYLAAIRAWAARVLDHPSFPVELRAEYAAETLAIDSYRVALAGAAPMLSPAAITDALSVLGATALTGRATCRHCGGPYERADAATGGCPWCRMAIDLDAEHPWVVGLARIASAPLVIPRPPLERAQIALQVLASNVLVTRKAVPAALVDAYLRASIPDVPRADLEAAYAQLRAIGMPI